MPIICCFFNPFKSGNQLLDETSHAYQGKFSEVGLSEIIHNNQHKFEPYAEFIDEAYENVNAKLVDNQDVYGQIENDETVRASYNKKATETDDPQNSSANLYSASLIPEIPPDMKLQGV